MSEFKVGDIVRPKADQLTNAALRTLLEPNLEREIKWIWPDRTMISLDSLAGGLILLPIELFEKVAVEE